jgi:iron complex transport system permease protein
MNSKTVRWATIVLSLLAILVIAGVVALGTGSTHIPIRDILKTLLSGEQTANHTILMDIRLPRIILAFAVGGALSLAGAILQGIFRNPLVEPYTLGISGGASLGVCMTIVLKLYTIVGVIAYPISGFLGAALTILIVYGISSRKEGLRIQGMLLIGVMISFISSSIVMLIMSVSRSEDIHGIVFWVMGSLEEPNEFLIKMTVGFSLAGLVAAYFFSMNLNALALGEEEAMHLGVNVDRTKKFFFLVASVLTGICVSVAGIIGFVGLVVPHFVRMFTGSDHRILFIGSFLAGASFLICCDTIARTIIAPLELPVGVITGIIGGSIFIYALSRKRVM